MSVMILDQRRADSGFCRSDRRRRIVMVLSGRFAPAKGGARSCGGIIQKVVLLLVSLLLLPHCASMKTAAPKVDEREVLKKRVADYWQLQIDGKIDQAYQYEVPAYREKSSLGGYMRRFNLVKYISADIHDVEVDNGTAKVKMTVRYKLAHGRLASLPKAMEFHNLDENWVLINGAWYHIPEGFTWPPEKAEEKK